MPKPLVKLPAWQRPRVLLPLGTAQSATELTAQARECEDAYDFEAAATAYRAAAAAASKEAALEYLRQHAEFLVERYGQFEEVAAWLDDPDFAPPAGTHADAQALTRLLARAAHETKHPRTAELDELATVAGDAQAAARHQERQAAQQAIALKPIENALVQHDFAETTRLLHLAKPQHGRTSAFLALEGRLLAAQKRLEIEELRRNLQEALTAKQGKRADDLAQKLTALHALTPEEKQQLQHLRAAQREQAIADLWQETLRQPTLETQLAVLAKQADTHGLTLQAPLELTPLWQEIRAVAQLPQAQPLVQKVPAVVAWHRLGQEPELAELETLLKRLPEAWHHTPVVKQARERLRLHEEQQRETLEVALTEQVQARLDADDLNGAAGLLDEAQQEHPGLAALRRLRAELSHLRHQHERRDKLRQAVQSALAADDVLTARARLADMGHLVDGAERERVAQEIEQKALPLLRGKPQPPGLQKLTEQALVTGVGLDRLVIVQETVWLTVNLATGGLQPFALPAGWPLQVHAWTRLAAVGEKLRLVGLSNQRLVVVEQVPGQPPQVVAGMPMAELLGEDDTLMGAALTPGNRHFALLSRSQKRGTAPTWTRLDAQTLAVLERKKAQPKLDSLCGVDGELDLALTVAAAKHRSEYLLAATDLGGKPQQRYSETDVGEPLADVRQAQAWPEENRLYARYASVEPFQGRIVAEPSLLVTKNGRVMFASTDLRRRFAPMAPLVLDHAWTLDPAAGRLWFAAQSSEGDKTALLLGVDARTLRADKPVAVEGVARILALHPVPDGAVALTRLSAGGYGLTRARMDAGELRLTTQKLPL